MKAIHSRLDHLSEQQAGMQKTLEKIAVQDEQIKVLQKDIARMWDKMDALVGAKGVLTTMQACQSSVPGRIESLASEVRLLWFLVVPEGIALLGVAVALCGGF